MQTDNPIANRSAPTAPIRLGVGFSALLALTIAAVAIILPEGALALAVGFCFLAVYFYRRDWLLGAIFVFLLFQNLAYTRLLPISAPLATLVKYVDDPMIVFFALALAVEAFFPTVRLNRLPRWQPFALLVLICAASSVLNQLTGKAIAIGTYVLLKNFVWFFLAASVKLDDRGYRNVLRFLLVVLGAILAFGVVQLLTGDLTYRLLGLRKDYRFGILRLRSIFVHPVYLAETMALLGVVAVSAYVWLRNPVYLVLAIGALVAVGLTMLVKTILALGLVVGLLLLRKRPLTVVPYVVGAVAAMMVFAEYGAENVKRQFRVYVESPQSVRREGYRICGEILRDSPIVGVGPGMFGGYAATLLDSPIPDHYGFVNYDQQRYDTIDSHWPHVVAEVGILGLLAYGWFLWSAGRASWRLSTRSKISPSARILGMAAAVFLLAAGIEAFAAANFESTICGFMIFSMLGLTQGNFLSADTDVADH